MRVPLTTGLISMWFPTHVPVMKMMCSWNVQTMEISSTQTRSVQIAVLLPAHTPLELEGTTRVQTEPQLRAWGQSAYFINMDHLELLEFAEGKTQGPNRNEMSY